MDALVRPLPTRKDSNEGVQVTFFSRLLRPEYPVEQFIRPLTHLGREVVFAVGVFDQQPLLVPIQLENRA